jgi:hypothetical protein
MRKLTRALLVGAVLVAGAARADNNIGSVQAKLLDARETLKATKGNFGSHRETAINLINRAIEELRQAQNLAISPMLPPPPAQPTKRQGPPQDRIDRLGR